MLINSLDHKGRGIGRDKGKIIFIENALPDEMVDIKVTKSKKNYDEAVVTNYKEVSKDRVTPLCPYYSICGGCHLQHLSYQRQLAFKQDKIENIIRRFLRNNIKVNDIVPSEQYYYRNKLTLQVNGGVGLYKRETNDLVIIDKCIICDSKINDKIAVLSKLDLSKIKQFIIRSNDEEILLIIVGIKDLDISPISKEFQNIIIKDDDYYLKKGNNHILKELDNLYYKISLDSFFQVNFQVMKKLYDCIKSNCINSHNVLDLYCGTGSISLYISDVVKSVYGIDINENAIKDANENKKINNIVNVNFKCIDTNDFQLMEFYDTIIIDPPRSGLTPKVIDIILSSNCDKLIYVSCDPMTLARDLNKLKEKYNIIELTPFDMFPNTYHLENLVVLEKM